MERKWTPLWHLNRFGSQYSVSRCRSVCLSLFLPDLVSTHMSSVRKLCIFAGPLGCARKLTAGPDPLVHSAFLVSTSVAMARGRGMRRAVFPLLPLQTLGLSLAGFLSLCHKPWIGTPPHNSCTLWVLEFALPVLEWQFERGEGSRASNQSNLLVTTLRNGWEPGLSQG